MFGSSAVFVITLSVRTWCILKRYYFQPSFPVSGPVMHDCTNHPRDSKSSSLCVTPVLSAKDPVHRPSTLLQPLEFCSAHCLDSVPFALKTMFSNSLRWWRRGQGHVC